MSVNIIIGDCHGFLELTDGIYNRYWMAEFLSTSRDISETREDFNILAKVNVQMVRKL